MKIYSYKLNTKFIDDNPPVVIVCFLTHKNLLQPKQENKKFFVYYQRSVMFLFEITIYDLENIKVWKV